MITQEKINESILGDLSKSFQKKVGFAEGNIVDIPEQKELYLYPAGFTKDSRPGINRQGILSLLFNFPKKELSDSTILFKPENNPHDASAIRIFLMPPKRILDQIRARYISPEGLDIGFVPRRVNKVIRANMHMITEIRLADLLTNIHGKYYQTQILVKYTSSMVGQLQSSRFANFGE